MQVQVWSVYANRRGLGMNLYILYNKCKYASTGLVSICKYASAGLVSIADNWRSVGSWEWGVKCIEN